MNPSATFARKSVWRAELPRRRLEFQRHTELIATARHPGAPAGMTKPVLTNEIGGPIYVSWYFATSPRLKRSGYPGRGRPRVACTPFLPPVGQAFLSAVFRLQAITCGIACGKVTSSHTVSWSNTARASAMLAGISSVRPGSRATGSAPWPGSMRPAPFRIIQTAG
jgi:hypothetical protein